MVAAMDAVGVDGALLVSPFTMYRYGLTDADKAMLMGGTLHRVYRWSPKTR
jgi:hypothetical protein